MVEEQTARLGETDEAIQSKIDELLAGMTAAEKAGQLTQYFYFRLPADTENPALGLVGGDSAAELSTTFQVNQA